MKRKNGKMITALMLALVMLVSVLAGCGQMSAQAEEAPAATSLAAHAAGVLRLKVNPELAVAYDENGNVVGVEARNDDGEKILADFSGYAGKDAAQVISELVEIMGNAGYFVEEIEGEGTTGRQITIEVEDGSKLPSGLTMQDVVDQVIACVKAHNWAGFVVLEDDELYELDDRDDIDDVDDDDDDDDRDDIDDVDDDDDDRDDIDDVDDDDRDDIDDVDDDDDRDDIDDDDDDDRDDSDDDDDDHDDDHDEDDDDDRDDD